MKNQEYLNHLRHTAAHLLAAAVAQLYPDAKRTIGPAIDNGFYYDFDFATPISEEDLPRIEEKMHQILKDWHSMDREEVSVEEAKERYKDNPYKLELIEEFAKEGKTLTFYKSGDYSDLCKGGHVENPAKELRAFKLLTLAGAYWRGSEKNPMLTRIYGTAFGTQKELDAYLTMLEEAKKRDHKKLGKELELFFFHETSPGMAYWLPKGLTLYNTLYAFTRETYKKYGYEEVATPQLNKKELYETSGHWGHYRENMFIAPMSYITGESKEVLEGSEVFGFKPMNCPNAMNIFSMKTRSYNDLPMRLAETTLLHRYELSGTLNGLFRIRQFRQDDAHIFITVDQVQQEFTKMMDMIEEMYKPFGLEYRLRFGTRPENYMGEASDWDVAENALRAVLDESKVAYDEVAGEGAFYGPKIDILMKDSLGRGWQTGTIQLDFQQPKNFGLEYIDEHGKQVQPVVFHRALYGSLERFLGIIIEHYAGALPTWLAPVQIALLPIADRHVAFSQEVADKLTEQGIRVVVDTSANTLQAKIRDNTLQKVPYMGIIGDKETENNLVALRSRKGDNLGTKEILDITRLLQDEIYSK